MKPFCAVVTGASSGIGESFARELAIKCSKIFIVARRLDRLQALALELKKINPHLKVECVALDLVSPGAAFKLFETCTQENHPIHLLINNAGIGPYRYFLKEPLHTHLATIQLNLSSVTELCYYFADYMLKQGEPAYLANVASVAAFQGFPRFAVYAATKAYLRSFSTTLQSELKASPVSVSCICPGGTATGFLSANGQEMKKPFLKNWVLMSPEKVAKIGLKGVFSKKPVVIPGFFNQWAAFMPRLLPLSWSMRISAFAMSTMVQESHVPRKE